MSLEAIAHREIYPLEFYRKFLNKGVRPDGRLLTKCRATSVKENVLNNCDGSSIVKIGKTTVTCAVHCQVTSPQSLALKDGFIDININVPSFCCSKYYNLSKKSIYNKEMMKNECDSLSQQLNDLIIESKIFDLSSLCIESEKAVWILYFDVTCLCNDGNIFDASLLSIIAAIKNLRIPKAKVISKIDSTVQLYRGYDQLSLKCDLLPLTVGILDEQIIVDPTLDETELLQSQISIVFDNDANIINLYKPGGCQVSVKDLQHIFKLAQTRANDLIKLLTKHQKNDK